MTVVQSADSSKLILGGWKFVTAYQVKQETGEREPIFPGLKGHLIFLSDRMFCFTSRDAPNGVKDGVLLVYTGPCKVSADSFTTSVDMTSIDGYLGSKQKRFFKIDGDTLDIRPAGPDGTPPCTAI
jgi:hypothetical protein